MSPKSSSSRARSGVMPARSQRPASVSSSSSPESPEGRPTPRRPGPLPPPRRPRGAPAPPCLRRGGRAQLLADDPQRQELVALQAQDRLEPLDVVLAEQPVAALCAPWREEALVLEV